MYYKHPHENFFQKSLRTVEGGLKIYGTARGVYEAGTAIASGLRTAYQVAQAAGPALALM